MKFIKRLWETLFMSEVNEQAEVQEESQPEVQQESVAEPVAEQSEAPAADVATTDDHSAVKEGLAIAGHDVDSVWDDVVKFAEASVDDFDTAAKKALQFIGHGAASAYDAVLSLVKHKS